MKKNILDHGRNNQIDIHESVQWNGSLRIVIHGHDNHIEIGKETILNTGIVECLRSDSSIRVGERCKLNGNYRCRANRTNIKIDDCSTFNGVQMTLHEEGTIHIGKDCMFAGEIRLDVSDMHGIFDAISGIRINTPQDIVLEEHVWVGHGVNIMKGVCIGGNSVIGAQSLVTSDIPRGVIAAGVPAKIIREKIIWDRKKELPASAGSGPVNMSVEAPL